MGERACLLAPPSCLEPGRRVEAPPEEQAVPFPKRTSTHAPFRSRCSERDIAPEDKDSVVKLIVFDLDETLTLMSYMVEEGDGEEVVQDILRVCFETPWVKGSRLAKLRTMLGDLRTGPKGERRHLAVLTRNSSGAKGVLRLLGAADLARFFTVVWTMPWRILLDNAAYRDGEKWVFFDPPLKDVDDHKADVLQEVARNPAEWFPKLRCDGDASEDLEALRSLKLESIVLVDDQRGNFQSTTGATVKRYCKVARYDAHYRNLGLCRNMGGIGAHTDADYATLKTFVASPSMCRETYQLHCVERSFPGQRLKTPVSLIVFDLDETLTIATFMPQDVGFAQHLDWSPASLESGEWSEADLLEYNFETPFVEGGGRLEKLRRCLGELQDGDGGQRRALAVLSRNSDGVIAVINLLKMASLSPFFSAVWILPRSTCKASGAYQENGVWRCFDPPLAGVPDSKADVLRDVVARPKSWFPQLQSEDVAQPLRMLLDLRPESVVHVDDERNAFDSRCHTNVQALRFCKVARYDAEYRCCGHLNQLGGVGAHSDADYQTLKAFVDRPWEFAEEEEEETPAACIGAQAVVACGGDAGADGLGGVDGGGASRPLPASEAECAQRRDWRKRPRSHSDDMDNMDKIPRRRKSKSACSDSEPCTPATSVGLQRGLRSRSFCASPTPSPSGDPSRDVSEEPRPLAANGGSEARDVGMNPPQTAPAA